MSARTCSRCSAPMDEGYFCCGEYYCSRKCLDTSFEGLSITWEQHYEEDGDCYWTVFEELAA